MSKLLIISLSLSLLLLSCSSGVELIPVSKEPLLNDLNSKVWLVDKLIKNDTNYAPGLNTDKNLFVFYHNGKCLYQTMKTLGEQAGKRGEYSLHANDMNLNVYFPDEKWSFHLSVISEDTLLLDPVSPTDIDYSLLLIPFPEL